MKNANVKDCKVGGGKQYLILYKNNGCFYHAYGIDAYILNLIFNYKVLSNNKCGFPESIYEKVIEKIEDLKISYQIIYKDKKPKIKNYKILNKYKKYHIDALNKMNKINRIDMAIKKIKDMPEDDLDKLLRIIENVSDIE